MRGKAAYQPSKLGGRGITPARAGKRSKVLVQRHTRRDHPRACGEKNQKRLDLFREQGSPPRVRGKGVCTILRVKTSGITPARAGKSAGADGRYQYGEDHPRACGEKRARTAITVCLKGSPPRVRGKGPPCDNQAASAGITPARAGKSWCVNAGAGFFWDHPRACGEKHCQVQPLCQFQGSPPRVRGKVRPL